MCGIAGIVRWENPPGGSGEIEGMTAAVAHRGPDGVGFYRRGGVALGHRRLSIIDPELGAQPMSDAEGELWVTYNGELYNFRELREELRQRGHRFVTNSDTEVVVAAYREWGEGCVRRFRGMFAFAAADFRRRVLFLARDHFGIKPLYYREGGGYLAFASELGALRRVEDAPPAGSLRAVDLYLRYNYIPTPHTIYRGVYKLPPASHLTVSFDGGRRGPVKYWDVRFKPEGGLSEREWEERAEEAIRESVRAHLVADVPFGVFLSGGIDSTLVAWQMSELLGAPVRAFAIGFREERYSELPYAEEAARRCGVELHTEVVGDDSLNFLPDLVAHYGEPFGDSSCVPTWHVSRLARRHVPMVLSGDGGDEAFGGYWSYDSWMKSDPALEARRLMRSAIKSAAQFAPRASFYWFRKSLREFTSSSGNKLSKWEELMGFIKEQHRRDLWLPQYHDLIDQASELFETADLNARNLNRLDYAQYIDFQTYLPCDILTKVDVASMYHGLEVRTPLVDLRVVELAASLPDTQRYRRERFGQGIGKYITKKILAKRYSQEFVHRPKMGFGIPRAEWFYEGRSGWQLWYQVTADERAPLYQFFKREQVQALIAAHSPEYDNSMALWLLLVLGIWLEQNPEISFS
jgi:asparagine synthase (glutamine-hydrolysing)